MIQKIVSGGQTGADRAALDFAIENGIPYGGWSPKGRIAEDGTIPERYILKECTRKGYPARTEQNVVDSDATVIISIKSGLSKASQLTANYADKHGKPWIHIHHGTEEPGQLLMEFLQQHDVKILNVAGPRASGEPEVTNFVRELLANVLSRRSAGSSSCWQMACQ